MEHEEVLAVRRGHTGFLTLNRPRALNALNVSMIDALAEQLDSWAQDPQIAQVLIHGAGDRGLCAGGDIVALYREGREQESSLVRDFFENEYRLNAAIARFPKPYIALMDGIVLGGGVGVSAHGSVRIVTERTKLGMPETGIGFIPDVGATYLLPRVPGELGTYMALTGSTVTGADAIALGLADHYVPSQRLDELMTQVQTLPVEEVLASLAEQPPSSEIMGERAWIDGAFAGEDLLAMVERLKESGKQELAQLIESKSPTASFLALALVRRGSGLELEEALEQELRVGGRLFASGEMPEGIRAQVIDKDKTPAWNPPILHEVSPEVLRTFLAP